MRQVMLVVCWILSLTIPIIAQTPRPEPLSSAAPRAPYQRPVMAMRPYQHTWYDGMLRQFNPDNLDWGQWIEQRRQEFLNQSAANPYFKYSLVVTALLVLMSIALAKALIDKSRVKWLAQERYEDLLRQDALSRQEAHAAIRRYNEHVEKCNRVIEAELGRPPITTPTTEVPQDLHQALSQLADIKREHGELVARLEKSNAAVGDLTTRLEGAGSNGGATSGDGSSSSEPTQGELVKQLNQLREQLYHERERNKQLKGM